MVEAGLFNIQKFEGRHRQLFFILVATLPWGIALNSIIIGLLFLNCFSAPRSSWRMARFKDPLIVSFFLFWLVNFWSILYSENTAAAWTAMETKTSFLLLPFSLALGWKVFTEPFQRLVEKAFYTTVIVAAVYCLLYSGFMAIVDNDFYRYWSDGGVRDHYFFYTGLSDPLMHPGYLSLYTGIAIFICWKSYLREKKQFLIYVAIPFLLIFLLMLQGRMNIIAFGLVATVYAIYRLISLRRYKMLMGVVLAISALILIFFTLLPKSVSSRFTESFSTEYDITSDSFHDFSGITIRLAEWHCAVDVIEENIWLGTGIGDSKDELYNSYVENNFTLGIDRKFNCHNQYLESTLAAGIPGLLSLLLMLLAFLYKSIRSGDVILTLMVLYFFLSMITESLLVRHWAITLLCSFVLFTGFMSGKNKVKTDEEAEK